MTDPAYFCRLRTIVDRIGSEYFIDTKKETIDGKTVSNWNILLMAFAYAGRMNSLLIGDKGHGKTGLGGILASIMTSLPCDLYSKCRIQGNNEHTIETLALRTDIAALHEAVAREACVALPHMFLPVYLFDEINRCTSGKQSLLMEFIRKGSISLYGQAFESLASWIATMNPNGAGTYPLPLGALDRFHIALEPSVLGAIDRSCQVQCEANVRRDLCDSVMSREIEHQLLDKTCLWDRQRGYVQKKQAEFQKIRLAKLKLDGQVAPLEPVTCLTEEEIFAIRQTCFEPHALSLLRCFYAELNQTSLYGANRSSDLRDTSAHNAAFASSKVLEGDARCYDDITFFAGMLARYTNSPVITIDHVLAVTPYILWHRLDFTDDWRAKWSKTPHLRDEDPKLDLTRRLVLATKDNYWNMRDDLHTLDMTWSWATRREGPARNSFSPSVEQLALAHYFLTANTMADHPYLRDMLTQLASLQTKEKIEALPNAAQIKAASASIASEKAAAASTNSTSVTTTP